MGWDPHAGSQAHEAGLVAVVPRPPIKERERWVGEKNFDSHGGVWIFKSFLRST